MSLSEAAENMMHVPYGSPDRSDYATAHYVATDTGQMLEIFLVLGMHAWRANVSV